jgi:hypothetical protein
LENGFSTIFTNANDNIAAAGIEERDGFLFGGIAQFTFIFNAGGCGGVMGDYL